MSNDFMTLRQAAEHYGVHYTTMLRMVHDGMVPGAFKVRRQWRIRIGTLEGAADPPGEEESARPAESRQSQQQDGMHGAEA